MKCECGICKTCKNRIATKKYREKWPERRKLNDAKQNAKKKESGYQLKKYREDPKYKEKSLARNKKRAQVSPEKVRAEIKRHQEKHRDKYLARQDLRRAVARGKIIKPKCCELCNKEAERIEGHHQDYSKRLEVIWMCVDCHKSEHGKL